jgi:hypothetical protein
LLKDGLCSKIKLVLAEIGFTHVWVNQGTFSKSKLLHSLSIKLEHRYIGEVGKGKRVDVYLEVRKRRGHIFFE